MRSPIRYFGGKGTQAHHLVKLLPPHGHYVEVFAGGASLLFAKTPSPIETLNDLDEGVSNFYRVLRDPAQFEAFALMAALTPYSRLERSQARKTWRAETDPVRRAWAWFIAARQSFTGDPHQGGWSHSTTDTKRRMPPEISRYLSAIDGLTEVHQRLRRVQIEQDDWRNILHRYDHDGALFYLDPPYVPATRSRENRYACELTTQDHHDLTAALLELDGMAILSGYRSEAIHAPLEEAGWQRSDRPTVIHSPNIPAGDKRRNRTESLWLSPRAAAPQVGKPHQLRALP